MNSNNICLWPRVEVLQLIIPALGQLNRGFNSSLAIDAIKHLCLVNSDDKLVPFDKWLITAKNILKWNDNCIKLFWDMLALAVLYTERKPRQQNYQNEILLPMEHLIIFLLLHVSEPQVRHQSSSPSHLSYETMWPSSMDIDPLSAPILNNQTPQSTANTSMSSSSIKRTIMTNSPPSPTGHNNGTAALSPRSSAVKHLSSSPKHSKSQSEYLQLLRKKLPFILLILSCDFSMLDECKLLRGSNSPLNIISSGGSALTIGNDDLHNLEVYFGSAASTLKVIQSTSSVTQDILDSLKMIIGGGYSYHNEVSSVSSLHSSFQSNSTTNDIKSNTLSLQKRSLTYFEALSWFEANLSLNDVFYPSGYISSPTSNVQHTSGVYRPTNAVAGPSSNKNTPKVFFPPTMPSDIAIGSILSPQYIDGAHGGVSSLGSPSQKNANYYQSPQRIVTTTKSIRKSNPTYIYNYNSSTYIYIVTKYPEPNSISVPVADDLMTSNNSPSLDEYEESLIPPLSTQVSSHMTSLIINNDPCGGIDNTGNANSQRELSISPSLSVESILTNVDKMSVSEGELTDVSEKDLIPNSHLNLDMSSTLNQRSASEQKNKSTNIGLSLDMSGMTSEINNVNANTDNIGNMVDMQIPVNKDYVSQLSSFSIISSSKSSIYLLSPYSSGLVSSCKDCEIVIGPTHGVVTLIGCEKLKISICCRKLIIVNCLECDIHVATLTPTYILGDCRNLSFAPYNVAYRHLRLHIAYANLDELVNTTVNSSKANYTAFNNNTNPSSIHENFLMHEDSTIVNHWSVLCDVNICLESAMTTASPTGYAIDTIKEGVIILPTPPPSVVNIMPVEKFAFVTIPYRNEFQEPEQCPIPLPTPHQDAFKLRKKRGQQVQLQIQELLAKGAGIDALSNDSKSKKSSELNDKFLQQRKEQLIRENANGLISNISPVLTKKFMDWLVRSGKINEVVDLIRIDADLVKSYMSRNEAK